MNNKNNQEKIMEIFRSINEEYKIGKIKNSQPEPTGDLYIKIKINSFLFELFMTKEKYNSINKDINDGNEKAVYDKISNFIVECLKDIDIEYLFDSWYDPYDEEVSPFKLVDSLRSLERKTNHIIKNIKSKN